MGVYLGEDVRREWPLTVRGYSANASGARITYVCDPGDPDYVWPEWTANLCVEGGDDLG